MSFGFQFDESEMDEEYLSSSQPQPPFSAASTSAQTSLTEQAPFSSHSVGEMLQHLPSRISYSSIGVSLAGGERTQRLLRRDLFDARFQMLLDEDDDDDERGEGESKDAQGNGMVAAQGSVDAESDLIPGVYEGGLKTWECALDLVETIDALHATSGGAEADGSWSSRLSGKNVLELGCGTALPSLFLLSQVLKDPLGGKINLTLHLADYNAAVLQLVTLPNLLLTWYASPASSAYRTTLEAEQLRQERHELTRRGQDHFDTSAQAAAGEEGELAISDELLSSFSASLEERGIGLKFYSGAWVNFPKTLGKMDMLLTSETIYSLESLPALVELLSRYAKPEGEVEAGLVLVAAKVIYFGVGGGVESFKQTLGQLTPAAKVESLHSVTKGVGRTVLSVTF
ncbi:related to HPM1 - AdoMet-dependent methyltransferase [Ustilago trichophora]|uniref:protein-histidine N-methyltransferase n=1 Tax=Ustilago trichophora TaxID=86804 RepID=A0A5C3E271_9BASI|nr:related to HPM1 - AdoMet-dependent methyltransferase [Ustilago trichophora]